MRRYQRPKHRRIKRGFSLGCEQRCGDGGAQYRLFSIRDWANTKACRRPMVDITGQTATCILHVETTRRRFRKPEWHSHIRVSPLISSMLGKVGRSIQHSHSHAMQLWLVRPSFSQISSVSVRASRSFPLRLAAVSPAKAQVQRLLPH